MPEQPEKPLGSAQPEKAIALNVQLASGTAADQPVMANYTAVSVAQGIAHVDFGFIDPALFGTPGRAIRADKLIPKSVAGQVGLEASLRSAGRPRKPKEI
jgi:hypothetical protein